MCDEILSRHTYICEEVVMVQRLLIWLWNTGLEALTFHQPFEFCIFSEIHHIKYTNIKLLHYTLTNSLRKLKFYRCELIQRSKCRQIRIELATIWKQSMTKVYCFQNWWRLAKFKNLCIYTFHCLRYHEWDRLILSSREVSVSNHAAYFEVIKF